MITGRGNSTDPTEMDPQQLQNDIPLERYNAEKNRYQENCYIGESSTSQQQPEPEMKEEHHFPEEHSYSRSVPERIETLMDRIYRQKMTDQEADMKSILWLYHRVKTLPLVNTQNIKTNDGKFKDGHLAENEMMKKFLETYELKQNLLCEKLDLQLSEDSGNASLPTEQNEFSLACAPAQDRGSCKSFESKFVHFINQLYDNDNNEVEYKDFQGLEDALANTAWGEVPDYLKSIGIRIEDARGKATEFSHTGIQILVCAVIKEMEDMSLEDLDWGTLKKWVAALNYANEHGFQVGFADNLLQRNVVAYFQKKELS
ncbi:hypothetical protein E1A91_D11G387500v1 [Gossypium mustelinum]|uniref:Uncharacterized protein n=2 Tax=Gossypium mustelinum TaxID=34275 RepID=A0A5D2T0W3_GOSMU|nr:hypothetical protein E1A91_D11G387500v1 [Gossypium mustelinum]